VKPILRPADQLATDAKAQAAKEGDPSRYGAGVGVGGRMEATMARRAPTIA